MSKQIDSPSQMENQENDCKCDDGDSKKTKNKEHQSPSPVTVVLKVDFHCDGCIAKIIRSARHLQGVETVRVDRVASKLTLIGFMDPVKTTEKLQKKTKKTIELISPKPKKETKANNDSKPDKPKPVAVTTVSLKLNCSCYGCTKSIQKTISKTKGVYDVKMDKGKEMVTVTGTMDIKSVTENLRIKLKKIVKVVPEKKNKDKDKNKENVEGITKVGPPGLPCYGFDPGFGPHGFIGGPRAEFFSEEDQSFCCVM